MLELIEKLFRNLNTFGLPIILVGVGLVEMALGHYRGKWNSNERVIDILSYVIPKVVMPPIGAYYTLKLLPIVLPDLKNIYDWIPFWWGFFIIAVADDLTQYWYHRCHHEVPFLWRFHRTHHSANYMGMAMATRQNVIYSMLYSQVYLKSALVYLGLGFPTLFYKVSKMIITVLSHSSVKWDKPLYDIKFLHPLAWVLERLISLPATHHAHHADTNDGVGHYKGNYGNMFFIWDVLFGTGVITRKYPASYGLKHYQQEEWYAQLAWPFFKSRKVGSELSRNGPMVKEDEPAHVPVVSPLANSFDEPVGQEMEESPKVV